MFLKSAFVQVNLFFQYRIQFTGSLKGFLDFLFTNLEN